MIRRPVSTIVIFSLLALAGAPVGPLLANEAYTATNPSSGRSESVWAGVPVGVSGTEIFYSSLLATGWSVSEQISASSTPDYNPHLAFTPQADRRVAWWNDGAVDNVLLSSKPAAGGAWSAPVVVSDGIEDARFPRVAVFAGATHVVYEGVPAGGTRKVIIGKQEDPMPISRTLLRVTPQTGPVSARIHVESGRMWVDWVDSSSLMGWSEYRDGQWASVLFESCSGTSDVEAARERIRRIVLGL